MYDGGTTLEEAAEAVHAKATISMQEYCTEKTLPFIANHGHEVAAFNHPVGVAGTDKFLRKSPASPARRSPRSSPASVAAWSTHRRLRRPHPRQEVRHLRRSRPVPGPGFLPARARRRAHHRAVHQRRPEVGGEGPRRCSTPRRSASKLQGVPEQGPVAHAVAALHGAGGLPDRQHLRQVSGA